MHTSLTPHWDAWVQRREQVMDVALNVTEDELLFVPYEDEWSIKDVIQHLQTVDYGFALSAQRRLPNMADKEPVGPEAETALNMLSERLRSMTPVDAPTAVNPSFMEETVSFAQLKDRWMRTGVLWVQIFDELGEDVLDRPFIKHPRTGYLSAAQALRWLSAHYDNHIAQIEENQRVYAERQD